MPCGPCCDRLSGVRAPGDLADGPVSITEPFAWENPGGSVQRPRPYGRLPNSLEVFAVVDVWLERILFYGLALVTVGSALVVTFGRNLVRSAFALFFTLMGMAAMFVYLAADFVALVHILVYIGGILVLILFGIWLTHRVIDLDIRAGRIQLVPGVILGLVLMGLLGLTIRSFDLVARTSAPYQATASGIGRLLLSTYLLPFEIASVALVIALVGAIVIGRRETSR